MYTTKTCEAVKRAIAGLVIAAQLAQPLTTFAQAGSETSSNPPLLGLPTLLPGSSNGEGYVDPVAGGAVTAAGALLLALPGSVNTPVRITIEKLAPADTPPLGTGAVNLTGGLAGSAYRFLPDGQQFLKPVKVAIPYDPSRLPGGKTEDDIKTYYFDVSKRVWVPLERIQIDQVNKVIVSLTTHFTDMINATITVPDHPTSQLFNPNRLSDLPPPSPGAGITMIDPPSPNQQGDASVSYPLALPAGRKGMQPQLVVSYSSAAGNGWVGNGWDLSLPSVSVDTKWGVPRYSPQLETESYTASMAGGALLPMNANGASEEPPHRIAQFAPRLNNEPKRRFRPRKEGGYSVVVRHGNSPANYWWEVTEKSGVKHFFGATANGARDNNAVLTDSQEVGGQGNIGRWMLRQTQDTLGNTVDYYYSKRNYTDSSGYRGVQIYPDRIEYTSNSSAAIKTPPAYRAVFVTDFQEGSASQTTGFDTAGSCGQAGKRRCDISLESRMGFRTATAELLKRVDVYYVGGGASVLSKRYIFNYDGNSAYRKSLLASVSEAGTDGVVVATHKFDYITQNGDEGQLAFSNPAQWAASPDGPSLRAGPLDAGSGIGLNLGVDANSHFYFGIGSPSPAAKPFSGGHKTGVSIGKSSTRVTLMDIDGDGLSDRLFKAGGGVMWRKNLGGPTGTPQFAATPQLVGGLPGLGDDMSNSLSQGSELHTPVALIANKSDSLSFTRSYFTDVNSDGLVDYVHKGKVLFNLTNPEVNGGNPRFGDTSVETQFPINGYQASASLAPDLSAELTARAVANAPVDSILKWTAPEGNGAAFSNFSAVFVNAPVTARSPPAAALEAYIAEKGAPPDETRVSIELNGRVIWSQLIPRGSTETYTPNFKAYAPTDPAVLGPTGLAINKGDRIYFRVHSGSDGAFDQVEWNPKINYGVNYGMFGIYPYIPNPSPDHADSFSFSWNFDSTLLSDIGSELTMPLNGRIRFSGILRAEVPLTDAYLLWIRRTSPAGVVTYINSGKYILWNSAGTAEAQVDLANLPELEVVEGERIQLWITSDSPVALTGIRAHPSPSVSFSRAAPELFYVSRADGQPTVDNGVPILRFEIGVDATTFNAPLWPNYIPQQSVPPAVVPGVLVIYYKGNKLNPVPAGPNSDRILFKFKREKQLLWHDIAVTKAPTLNTTYCPSRPCQVANIYVGANSSAANDSNRFFYSYTFWSKELAAQVESIDLKYILPEVRQGNVVVQKAAAMSYGCNGDLARTLSCFNLQNEPETDKINLRSWRGWSVFGYNAGEGRASKAIDESLLANKAIDQALLAKAPSCDGSTVDPRCQNYWYRYSPSFTKNRFQGPRGAAEPGIDFPETRGGDPDLIDASNPGRTWISAAALSSSLLNTDFVAFPAAVPTATGGGASLPIKISKGSQITGSIGPVSGGPGETKGMLDAMDLNGDRFPDIVAPGKVQYSLPTGGLEASPRTVSSLDKYYGSSAKSISAGGSVLNRWGPQMVQFEIPGNIGANSNSVETMMVDINGDGLADRIRHTSGVMNVAENLGYGFSAETRWPLPSAAGISETVGANISFGGPNYNYASYSLAIGTNFNLSTSVSTSGLLDINGDGLPDYVVGGLSGSLRVAFNTGSGFSPLQVWNNAAGKVGDSESVNLGAGAYYTKGFCAPPPVCYKFNPGADISISGQRQALSFDDMDGDGYIDQLTSATGGDLKVAFNRTGPALLLKRITRPLGGTIDLQYSRIGNTFDQPQSKWVMSAIIVDDRSSGDGADATYTAVRYENGYFSRFEREFLGFSRVIVEQHERVSSTAAPLVIGLRNYGRSARETSQILGRVETVTPIAGTDLKKLQLGIIVEELDHA